MQITRAMPMYGYALSGIKRTDLSNLAEHHYLVTFIAWQLALNLKEKGAKIDLGRVLESTLVHDLGEIFGGDIGMPYAKNNSKAKELATAFEEENTKYLSKLFGKHDSYFLDLASQAHGSNADESVIAKIADYIEVTHYKFYMGFFSPKDIDLIDAKAGKFLDKLQDPIAKEELKKFFESWKTTFVGQNSDNLLYLREN